MSMSMVSRRVAGYRKGKRKSMAPPPPRAAQEESLRESAQRFAPFAVRAAPPTGFWSQKSLLKGMALLGGAIVCGGLAYFVLKEGGNASSSSAYAPPARTEFAAARPPSDPSFRRQSRVSVSAGGQTPAHSVAGADRALPTDNSFLATAYVRKKVSLPNISGVCVVKGNGSIDVAECLRRQE